MQVRKYIANMLFEFFVFSVRKELFNAGTSPPIELYRPRRS